MMKKENESLQQKMDTEQFRHELDLIIQKFKDETESLTKDKENELTNKITEVINKTKDKDKD
jgi:hypothetical protein